MGLAGAAIVDEPEPLPLRVLEVERRPPIALADPDQNIPAVTALLFSPVFVNPSMIGAMMGFYNPGNGVTVNFTPTKSF
jgi:hypothetical protein